MVALHRYSGCRCLGGCLAGWEAVSGAYMIWSSAAEDALVDAFSLAGSPIPC